MHQPFNDVVAAYYNKHKALLNFLPT